MQHYNGIAQVAEYWGPLHEHLIIDLASNDLDLHALAELLCDWDAVEILAVWTVVHWRHIKEHDQQGEDAHS